MEKFRSIVGALKSKAEQLYNARVQEVRKGIGKERHWNLEMCQDHVRKERTRILFAIGVLLSFPMGYGAMKMGEFIDDLYVSDGELMELSQQFYGILEVPFPVSWDLEQSRKSLQDGNINEPISRFSIFSQGVRGPAGQVEEALETWIATNEVSFVFSKINRETQRAKDRCLLEEPAKDVKKFGDGSLSQFLGKQGLQGLVVNSNIRDFFSTPLVFEFELNKEKKKYPFYEFWVRWNEGLVSDAEVSAVLSQVQNQGVSLSSLYALKGGKSKLSAAFSQLIPSSDDQKDKRQFLGDFLSVQYRILLEAQKLADREHVSPKDVLSFVMTDGVYSDGVNIKSTRAFKEYIQMALGQKYFWMDPVLRCGGGRFEAEFPVPEIKKQQEEMLSALYQTNCIQGEKTPYTSQAYFRTVVLAWFKQSGISAEVVVQNLGEPRLSCNGPHPVVFEKP